VKTLVRVLVGFGILAAAGTASAQTATTSFQVLANVQASCSVAATNLDFGQYDPFAATPKDGSSTISVTCTNGTTYGVSVPNPTTRSMAGPAGSMLNYGLYNDTGRTAAFGVPANSATGTGSAQSFTVYGRIPVGQTSARPGNYADTVDVTVTY
jgi:spore coat protein U-like protein